MKKLLIFIVVFLLGVAVNAQFNRYAKLGVVTAEEKYIYEDAERKAYYRGCALKGDTIEILGDLTEGEYISVNAYVNTYDPYHPNVITGHKYARGQTTNSGIEPIFIDKNIYVKELGRLVDSLEYQENVYSSTYNILYWQEAKPLKFAYLRAFSKNNPNTPAVEESGFLIELDHGQYYNESFLKFSDDEVLEVDGSMNSYTSYFIKFDEKIMNKFMSRDIAKIRLVNSNKEIMDLYCTDLDFKTIRNKISNIRKEAFETAKNKCREIDAKLEGF